MVIENLTQQIAALNPIIAKEIASNPLLIYLILVQLVLKVIFYPIALYIAGKKNQKLLFIVLFLALLILNDFALFPIVYLIFNRFSSYPKKFKRQQAKKKSRNKK